MLQLRIPKGVSGRPRPVPQALIGHGRRKLRMLRFTEKKMERRVQRCGTRSVGFPVRREDIWVRGLRIWTRSSGRDLY
jgi:hypothetical protein